MINDYRRTKTTVSFINYHFVFCPRYRRKIFLNIKVEERFKVLVEEICNELDIFIIAMECDKDHTHLFLNTLPTLSPKNKRSDIKAFERRIPSSHALAKFMDAFLFCFSC